ncbi:YlbF family regulator [Halobacterium bonnevillei]|uniref:YlbF family regulator n=1 Tax=Halobacterium bonnevillei TaxID=2692200 RepID=A0A6B0SE52_9EURY|nr:YlbF family regulator [Halobacterium bonnevillei]MXR19984.1 YlbF family regulator [Halobacterium bonnevillei]
MSVDSDSATATDASSADELARQLGEAITETPEYRAFEETKEAVETSEEVQQRISDFEDLRQEFMLARQTGDATQEDLERVQDAQEHLHDHPVMADYLDAQDALETRFEALNELISEPLAVDFVGESGACCQD